MTIHEVATLGLGVNLGLLLAFAVTLIGNLVDARRLQRAAEAHLKTALKREATSNWRAALSNSLEP